MSELTKLVNDLKRPFPAEKVHWRIGATNVDKDGNLKWGDSPVGQAMCYIDARDVMKRLDELFPMQWQDIYSHAGEVYICQIGIKVGEEWLWRANGAGNTGFEPEKGGMSDAFKRAAVQWGIGQYLYRIPAEWRTIHKPGRDWKLASRPELPEWATPEGYDRLILKIRPYSERNVSELIDLLKGDDPYRTYVYLKELPDKAIADMEDEFPRGDKTTLKRAMEDHRAKGRQIMVEVADDLGQKADADDSLGVIQILEDESERMQEILIQCLTPEQQDKVKIILKEREEQ